ncbi:DNA internalization-related competence protein ComEC/Rec2 [Thiobacillus sedimenti]|uniref:DNA internalization-related competence protein ComEC/Rec2 n=1 Tax=Thiobacillus sedimenti TaxID=3110231 RepID=A0ABZ1CGI6_9PROT|nr:DNA internalization-related competence protein ComEC/Rec2 [Thiobacillus sp. SCUT-2]WRS38299.1 DNA internalization-related competence protein ComEC/Rec2 [Thiobacillus sp. SCUT-2]
MRSTLIAFCFGVWLLQQQAALPAARWFWLLPLLSVVLWVPRTVHPVSEVLRRLAVMLLGVALGFAWAAWRADVRLAHRLPASWQGVDLAVVGVVSDLPQTDARGERFVLDVEQVLTPRGPGLHRIQLARYWPRGGARLPTVHAGERWRFTVRLKRPHGTHNPHGFDLEAWMLERDIAASGYVREQPAPQRLDARAATPAAWLAAARAAIRERIFATLGEASYAGVITALVIGDQRGIPHDQWRAFTRTGVNHLLSISGLHVTMIATLAGWGLAFVWRRVPRAAERLPARQAGLLAAVASAAAYAALAGFQVPAQRTLFMLGVLALAFWSRRQTRPFSALAWAVFVVLVIDPWAVLSAGFWLSFGAMAAIVWASFGRVGQGGKLRAWVTVQGAVTLALAPALLLLFQQVSIVSPLANAVAIPVVSWLVTPLALLGVIAPPLWHAAAALMGWLGQALAWASTLPWAVATRPAPEGWPLLLALAGTLWLLLPRGFPARAMGALLWLPLLFPPRASIAPGSFEADVIDVGQGTAVLVRTAQHALLYDTGPAFAESDAGERIVAPYLRATGVGALSGIIVSHDDNDHSGGLRSVLRDIPAGWLLHGLPASSPLLDAAPSPLHCERGQRWQWDGVGFEILNPSGAAYAEAGRRDNDYSCVLKVSRGGQSLMITGDAERRGELELLESGADLASTALVAGHHGSRTSSLPEFVARVHPQYGIFTVGYRNRFGHPHPQVVARFRDVDSRILRSDAAGLIRLTFGEAGVVASEYRPAHRRYWQSDMSDE